MLLCSFTLRHFHFEMSTRTMTKCLIIFIQRIVYVAAIKLKQCNYSMRSRQNHLYLFLCRSFENMESLFSSIWNVHERKTLRNCSHSIPFLFFNVSFVFFFLLSAFFLLLDNFHFLGFLSSFRSFRFSGSLVTLFAQDVFVRKWNSCEKLTWLNAWFILLCIYYSFQSYMYSQSQINILLFYIASKRKI